MKRWAGFAMVCVLGCSAAAFAQYNPQGGRTAAEENNKQAEHDRDVKQAMDQGRAGSNASAVMNQPIDKDALAKKIADGFKPYVKPETATRYEMSPKEEAEWAQSQKMIAAYHAGDVAAGVWLADNFYAKNPEFAFKIYYDLAAKYVHPQFMAGQMLVAGNGTLTNEDLGRAMIESAASSGDADAKAYLVRNPRKAKTVGEFPSILTRADRVVREVRTKAPDQKTFKRVEARAKKTWAYEYEAVAYSYLYGLGVPVDHAKAREIYSAAISLFPSDYDSRAGLMYVDFLERKEHPEAFIASVRTLVKDTSSPDYVYFYLAVAECMAHRPVEQRHALEVGGKDGQAPAPVYLELALMQLTGEGGPVQEAAGIYKLQAIASTNADAAYYLSQIVAKGQHGVAKDPAKAKTLLQAAAAGGQPDAKKQLEGFDFESYLNQTGK